MPDGPIALGRYLAAIRLFGRCRSTRSDRARRFGRIEGPVTRIRSVCSGEIQEFLSEFLFLRLELLLQLDFVPAAILPRFGVETSLEGVRQSVKILSRRLGLSGIRRTVVASWLTARVVAGGRSSETR